jgi:hypothetical protein
MADISAKQGFAGALLADGFQALENRLGPGGFSKWFC